MDNVVYLDDFENWVFSHFVFEDYYAYYEKKKAPLDQIDCENIKSTYIDILTNRKSAFWEIMLNIDNEAYRADFENWVFDCG